MRRTRDARWRSRPLHEPEAWLAQLCDRSIVRFQLGWATVAAFCFTIVAMSGLGVVLVAASVLRLSGDALFGPGLAVLGLILIALRAFTRRPLVQLEWRRGRRFARRDAQVQSVAALLHHTAPDAPLHLDDARHSWRLRAELASGPHLTLTTRERPEHLDVTLHLEALPASTCWPHHLDVLLDDAPRVERSEGDDATLSAHFTLSGDAPARLCAARRTPSPAEPDPATTLACLLERLAHTLEDHSTHAHDTTPARVHLAPITASNLLHWRPRELDIELDASTQPTPQPTGGVLAALAQASGMIAFLVVGTAASLFLMTAPAAPDPHFVHDQDILAFRALFCLLCFIPAFLVGWPRLRLGPTLTTRYAPVRSTLQLHHDRHLRLAPDGVSIDLHTPFHVALTRASHERSDGSLLLALELWQLQDTERRRVRVRALAQANPHTRQLPQLDNHAPTCTPEALQHLWALLAHHAASNGHHIPWWIRLQPVEDAHAAA